MSKQFAKVGEIALRDYLRACPLTSDSEQRSQASKR